MSPTWQASRGTDGAFYIVLRAANGFQMSPFWGPFADEPEAREVCMVRNLFAQKRAVRVDAETQPKERADEKSSLSND